MFVIVHLQCPKLFESLECAVLSMVLCTIKNPCHSIRIGNSLNFRLSVAILPWLYRNRCKTVFTQTYKCVLVMHTVSSCVHFIIFSIHEGCGSLPCIGSSTKTETCSGDTPLDCEWNTWGKWSRCSQKKCGKKGTMIRSRKVW